MEKLKTASLTQVKVSDLFWNKYTKLVAEAIIPYQWDILNDRIEDTETSHCISNFQIAAGLKNGSFQGAVFQDTDVAKWLEAVAYSLAGKPDKELEKIADEVIDLIGMAQQEDGYINTYFTIEAPEKRWVNLKEGHELYTAGHFMEAAVAYYQVTEKDKFLTIMKRFADAICDVFSEEKNNLGYPGHQEVEIGLFKLYEATGEKKYLEQAKSFIDRRGKKPNYLLEEGKNPQYFSVFPEFSDYQPEYSQSHLPVREQKSAEGHAVRGVYMYCAMADLAHEYQDKELLKACVALWNNIVEKRMYITGGIGSSGLLERFTTDFDLPNDSNYSETCASIGLALFGRRMAQITRDGKYMDIVEKALYNTLLSGTAMDGKSFFYVNPLEVWPNSCMPRTSKEHVKPVRQKWFGVACCPPNIARTLASLGEYIYFTGENELWINLFVSGKISIVMGGKKVCVKVDTAFPNYGVIGIMVEAESEVKGKIAIRIPAYVKKYSICIDGRLLQVKAEAGYVILENVWHNNKIEIEFQIPAVFIHANPRVHADSGKVAIQKGPLIYCLEETDNGNNLPSVYVDTSRPLEEEYDNTLLGGTTVIKLSGKKIGTVGWKDGELYKQAEKTRMEDISLKAVPYCYWGNRKTGEMLVWIKELI